MFAYRGLRTARSMQKALQQGQHQLPKLRSIHNSRPSNGPVGSVLAGSAPHGHLEPFEQPMPTASVPAEATDELDATALSVAAKEGHVGIVQHLLNGGANPNANLTASHNGFGPLLGAARGGHAKVVSVLLEHGANVNEATLDTGLTPLIIAAAAGHVSVVQTLLSHSARVNQATLDNGATALFEAAREGHANVVRLLLDNGADINQPTTDDKCTPLIVASEMGHSNVVRELLAAKPNLELARSSDGATALTAACTMGHTQIARLLLQAGANPNQRSLIHERGFITPFLATVLQTECPALQNQCKKAEIVKLLVQYRANVEEAVATAKQWDMDPDLLAKEIVTLLRI